VKQETVTLESLIGKHFLSGVEMGSMPKENEYDYADPNTVDFILDGKTYSAIEDPNDGYRSCMADFVVNREGVKVKNIFPKVAVFCRMADDGEYETNDILEFIDMVNGKTVLRIGTANTEDYYPCFIGTWTPENLNVNKGKT